MPAPLLRGASGARSSYATAMEPKDIPDIRLLAAIGEGRMKRQELSPAVSALWEGALSP
jgi:hypothetical protein